MDHEFDY